MKDVSSHDRERYRRQIYSIGCELRRCYDGSVAEVRDFVEQLVHTTL